MSRVLACDICGRSEAEISRRTAEGSALKIENGLRLCQDCSTRLANLSEDDALAPEPDEHLRRVIGKSAGAICMTMNLPYEPPYCTIIDAASRIAYDSDRYMSTWIFESLWLDGTTVWRDEDASAVALVHADGSVDIQSE
jgi:hypothetical protein